MSSCADSKIGCSIVVEKVHLPLYDTPQLLEVNGVIKYIGSLDHDEVAIIAVYLSTEDGDEEWW